jgi:hypothetical protein
MVSPDIKCRIGPVGYNPRRETKMKMAQILLVKVCINGDIYRL